MQVIFDATEHPEQIALAARYLNDPNSVQGKPVFDRAILALMQYPSVLQQLSRDLVWVSELGQVLTDDESHVWAQLEDQRLTPDDLAQPETVERAKPRVVYRSRPTSYRYRDPWPTRASTTYVVYWDRHSHRHPMRHRHHHHYRSWGHSNRHNPFWYHGYLRHPDQFLYQRHRQLERTIARERQTTRREPQHDSRRRPPEPYMSGTVFGPVSGAGLLR